MHWIADGVDCEFCIRCSGGGFDDDNGLSGDLLASQDGMDCEFHIRMILMVVKTTFMMRMKV